MQDKIFDQVIKGIDKRIPIISFGFDPSLWSYSNVPAKIVSTVNAYVVYGGPNNIKNMLKYIGHELLGYAYEHDPPSEILWQGLYHPDAEKSFSSVEEYLKWYGKRHKYRVGILFFRTYWANRDTGIVDSFIGNWKKSSMSSLHFVLLWEMRI